MHIYGHTKQRYLQRDLTERQLSAFDEHVANCLACAHALADEAAASTEWERRGLLGRLVPVERVPITELAETAEVRAA